MKRLGPFRLRRDTVARHYDIHSWLGLLGGLVFFICVYSGSLALFEQELLPWEQPQNRLVATGEILSPDQAVAIAYEHFEGEPDLFVTLPSEANGGYTVRSFGEGGVETIRLHPSSGEVVESEHEHALHFLTHLHTDLHLPRPLGRYLVGFLGIFMLMSLISGIMAHPKMLKEFFLLRWRPSLRITFSDLHKQLGVWGLAFGLVMSFTGAILGLLGLFAPIMVLSAFGGDVEKATEAFSGPHYEETGQSATMLSVDQLMADLEGRQQGMEVGSLNISHWGDETAEVGFNLTEKPERRMVGGETHRLSLVDGSPIFISAFTDRGAGNRLFGMVQPLHYALYGSLGLKLIYFVSGLVLSFGILSGTVIWLQRREAKEGTKEARRYKRLGQLHLGVSLGLVLASVLALGAGRWAPGTLETVFWTSWLACSVAAFTTQDGYRFTRIGVFAIAGLLALVALGDLFSSSIQTPVTRQVSLVLLALALLTAAGGAFSPRRGKSKKRRKVSAMDSAAAAPAAGANP
ncbi:MAG: PepSY-associated TM helix domain-containing protein [Acidobacteriota bacterium]